MENSKELLELLEKNLPKMQIDVLRKELDKISNLEKEVKSQNETIKIANDKNNELVSNQNLYFDLVDKEHELKAREKIVEDREKKFEIELLKEKLSGAQNNNNNMFSLVSLLMKNPRAIELINGMENISLSSGNGCSFASSAPFNQTKEKFETKEEHNLPL